MPKHSNPQKGSMQFWPRVRAKRIYPTPHWPAAKELKPVGFAAWKAGMTHVQLIDNRPSSPTYNKLISIPVTILDAPSLFVFGVRYYSSTYHGLQAIGEKWSEKIPRDLEMKRRVFPSKNKSEIDKKKISDIRLLVASQPAKSGMRKKRPDIFELSVGGENITEKINYAEGLIGKEINIKDIFRPGELIDISAVTRGHGYTGPVTRFGIRIQRRKDKQMNRHAGSIGSTVPRKVDWRVPLAGQYGFFTRTEYNKRIIMINDDPKKINPSGGIINYGIVPETYVLIEGSVPGHKKRLIMLSKSRRSKKSIALAEPQFISLQSQQGV